MGRRGKNEGSIHKRGDGRWVATFDLGWSEGRRKRKSLYGRTRHEVAGRLVAALRAQQQGLPSPNDRLTLKHFMDAWLTESVKPTVRERTHASYAYLVRMHIDPEIGRWPLGKLGPAHLRGLMNKKLHEGLSPRTVQYIHSVLRGALNQAERWGLVARNVARLVSPPRVPKWESQPLTLEEARIFLAAIKGDPLEALYSVAIAIGLRQGEALGLQWSDIDLNIGLLTVHRSLQRVYGRLQLVEPKTERSRRTVKLPNVAVQALRTHRTNQLAQRLVAGPEWRGDSRFHFYHIGRHPIGRHKGYPAVPKNRR